MFARNGEELIRICKENNISLCEYAILHEIENKGSTREKIIENMKLVLNVMKDSTSKGQESEIFSVSGLIGGDAYKLKKYLEKGNTLTGETMVSAMAKALSCSEINASMGRIVACPTAGSCGILPAVILTVGEKLNLSDDEMIKGLLTASAVGMIIAQNATLAGAEGGCQAIVFKNILGLVCDPIAGLVEVPCAKRNFAGAVSALTTADLVMAGITSKIPFDDTVEAMYRVGRDMPASLRETAMGGLAITKTGLELNKKVFGDKK